MTFELFWTDVVPQILNLALYLSLGILVAVLLEITGVLKLLARIARPLLSLGHFSPDCAAAFVAAFASAKTAHAMLAASYKGGSIQRRELILGAVANTLPTALMKLKFFAPLMISVLGLVGLAYVIFIVAVAVVVFLAAVILSRFLVDKSVTEAELTQSARPTTKRTAKSVGHLFWDRWWRLTLRVIAIAIPVFTLMEWMQAAGTFQWLNSVLPGWVDSVFPAQSMSIIVAQFTRTSVAVSTAKSILESGALTPTQVFFTLVAGYCLSLPLKVMRRNLPSAVSIFPETTGLWIIGISQGLRLLLALLLVGTYMVISA